MQYTMYVDTSTVHKASGKSYKRHLLCESYRKEGKVKHRTITNLSSCTAEEIEAIRLALAHKHHLSALVNLQDDLRLEQGLSVGAVWTVFSVAKQLGIVDALGSTRAGKLALWQVLARVIDQGSRLSGVRLAESHAACDILDLKKFNEDGMFRQFHFDLKVKTGISLPHLTPTLSYQGERDRETLWPDHRESQGTGHGSLLFVSFGSLW